MIVSGRFQNDLLRELSRSGDASGVDSSTISDAVHSAMRCGGSADLSRGSSDKEDSSVFLGGFELLDLLEGLPHTHSVMHSKTVRVCN